MTVEMFEGMNTQYWNGYWHEAKFAILIAIGAIAMRGAGCTYNDIVDQGPRRTSLTAQLCAPYPQVQLQRNKHGFGLVYNV